MNYGKRIKDMRTQAGITQEELSARMKLLTPNFISQIETGRKKAGLSVIEKVCSALDISLADFLQVKEPSLTTVAEEEEIYCHPVFTRMLEKMKRIYKEGDYKKLTGLQGILDVFDPERENGESR